MSTLDTAAWVLVFAGMAIAGGGLGLYIIVERLHAGYWPWLLDLLAWRKWK